DGIDLEFRRACAARTFARVAAYDLQIEAAFARATESGAWPATWTERRTRLPLELRYGENPHQSAAVYRDEPAWGLGLLRQCAGPELSFNTLLDADAAGALVGDLGSAPACALVKHNNPCGAASAERSSDAFRAALASDPVSAFGGIAAFNVPVDAETADAIGDLFLEIVCAPAFEPRARERLAAQKRLRLLELPGRAPARWDSRLLHGLWLRARDPGRVARTAGGAREVG